jgi:hypothetical protein
VPDNFNLLSYAIVQWVSSIFLSLLIVAGMVAIILTITGWGYVWLHPVAAYEEDLGYGLVMMAAFVLCSIVAVPASGFLAWGIKKFIARKLHDHSHP